MEQKINISQTMLVVNNKLKRLFSMSFEELGLTGTQAPILHFIYTNGKYRDVFQRDIETGFNIRRSSVTSVLHGLEKQGYIKRISVSEDARLKKLVLTDKAIGIIENINDAVLGVNSTMLKGIPQEDIIAINRILQQISANLE